ncbi:MAG TPA: GAF and ANTAR domain-containing protein [Candidatus Omnitrophota bacterium]|nr:GAF and ANTAR domain-containing protein [Candidatus Omnitrophota bacterium]HRZ14563.1 GAF and ANTAR domain-containing protein [Candidatus Omnitrophota bacterium]
MESKLLGEQIRALSRISKAITSEHYLDDILKLVVVVTAEAFGSNICSIMLLDDKKKELTIKASQSISDEYNRKPPLRIGEGVAGRVVKENRPSAVKDVQKEKEYKFKDIAKKEKLRSLLCVPLAVKGKVIGVLNCYTSTPHDFTENEEHLISAIANQVAVAIENTELIVKSRVILEELEARKIIERAKGILMHGQALTEEQAYLHIRKYSMDNRKTMREVAEAIILTEEMKRSAR